jgi:hypothetical protein
MIWQHLAPTDPCAGYADYADYADRPIMPHPQTAPAIPGIALVLPQGGCSSTVSNTLCVQPNAGKYLLTSGQCQSLYANLSGMRAAEVPKHQDASSTPL